MLRFAVRLVMILATLSLASRGSADTIVDTGTPDESLNWGFFDWQYFAGEFSTFNTYTLQSIEGYFSNSSGTSGQVTVGIHADGGSRPGALLFSSSLDLAGLAPLDWHGVSVNQLLGPGTYWASFIPSAEIAGTMPGAAPNPLDEYALGCSATSISACGPNVSGGWYDTAPDTFDFVDVGIRINGEIQPVPDSTSTFALMLIVGLLGAVAVRWRAGLA